MHPSKEFQHIGRFSRTLEIWQIVNTSINPITIPPLDLKLSAVPVTLYYKLGGYPDPIHLYSYWRVEYYDGHYIMMLLLAALMAISRSL